MADEIIGLTHDIKPIGGDIKTINIIGKKYNRFLNDELQIRVHTKVIIIPAHNQRNIAI